MNISKHTDILVIGRGMSDAIAAISAADEGKNVLIISKTPILKSGNPPKAQGDIVYKVETNYPEKLKEDIIKAGDNHCSNDAVNLIC